VPEVERRRTSVCGHGQPPPDDDAGRLAAVELGSPEAPWGVPDRGQAESPAADGMSAAGSVSTNTLPPPLRGS